MRQVFLDLSSTIRLPFTSGVQRVARGLLKNLTSRSFASLDFVPIAFCPSCEQWRHLSNAEVSELLSVKFRPTGAVGRFATFAGMVNRSLLGFAAAEQLHRTLRRSFGRCRHGNISSLPNFTPDSIFLDADSAWHSLLSRTVLLPALAERGVTIANIHHDIIPLLFPEWVHPHTVRVFKRYLHAHLTYSNLFICVSSHSREDLIAYHKSSGHLREINTTSFPLGGFSISMKEQSSRVLPELGPFVLAVGTLEPRKNYWTLLDVFEGLIPRFPQLSLVIVGRKGWMSSPIVSRIREHPLFNKQLFWLQGISDGELASLYQRATLCIVPSLYEGYGLPVLEALSYGCITLSSNTGALPEAGGKLANYFEPEDRAQLAELVTGYLDDPARAKKRREQISQFTTPTWDASALELAAILEQLPID